MKAPRISPRSFPQVFVSSVWATHNDSRPIRTALHDCLQRLAPGKRGLNVGSGDTNLHPAVINLDANPSANSHVCGLAERLPLADNVFDLVITQETLEHVRDPFKAIQEMWRVLRPGGILYCQTPFVIGYHPGPTDFWRFTREGIQELVEQGGFYCCEVTLAVGPATGFYRIVVEFFATVIARFCSPLYLPMKGLFALLFFPLKWLDPFLMKGVQADRVAGGYLVIATRS